MLRKWLISLNAVTCYVWKKVSWKKFFLMIFKYFYNDHVASECILTHKQNIGDHLTYKNDNPINPHE